MQYPSADRPLDAEALYTETYFLYPVITIHQFRNGLVVAVAVLFSI